MASPWPLTFSSGERPRALWALLLITLVIQYCNCTETNTFRSYCSKVTVKSFILWAQNFVVWCWWTYSWTLEFVDFQIKHTTINLNQQLIGILNLRIVLPSKYLKLNVQQIKMNSQYSHWSESHACDWQVGSRRVVVVAGIIMALFGCFGKFSALVVSMPDPIIGASFLVLFGEFKGSKTDCLIYVWMLFKCIISLSTHICICLLLYNR